MLNHNQPFSSLGSVCAHRGRGAVAAQRQTLDSAPLAAVGVGGAAVAVGVLLTALALWVWGGGGGGDRHREEV